MRPLRNRDPRIYRLITIRTGEARLWIVPNSKTRRVIGGIVARYQEIFGIEIYAYCFLGNHYHLLVRALQSNVDEFCENVNREVARRINYINRREGKFWGRRYDDQQVLTEEDALEAFLYINTNPTRHGLVADSRQWPGLSSFEQAISGKSRVYSFIHYSATDEEQRVTTHTLKLTPLPQHKKLKRKRRANHILKILKERCEHIVSERKAQGLGFLGLSGVQGITPGDTPQKVSRSERPLCYTSDAKLRKEFQNEYRERRGEYDEASMRYRLGLDAEFPPYSFKPPLHRLPRLIPFTPLTVDHFKQAA